MTTLKTPRENRSSALLALVLEVASCHGKQAPSSLADGSVEQGPVALIELADFCAKAVPAYCSHLARCRPQQANEPYGDCLAHQGPAWCAGLVLPKFVASVAAGRMRWDAVRAGTCVDNLAAASCRTLRASEACSPDDLFAGTVEPGGACLATVLGYRSECRRGYCKRTGPCVGTCTPLQTEGSTCTSIIDCAGGLYCIDPASGADCSQGGSCTCVPRLRGGDACLPTGPACDTGFTCVRGYCAEVLRGQGQPCRASRDCAGDLACLPTSGGDTCGPRGQKGDSCRNIEECAAGLTCRQDRLCGPFSTETEDCADGDSLHGGGDCALGYTCLTVRCAPRPTTAGQACGQRTQTCFGKNLYCSAEFACAAPAQSGESCEVLPCADPSLDCRTTDRRTTCVPRLPLGAACVVDEDCASDLCYPDVCVAACTTP
jgi:hypothetical protein